MAKVIHLGSVPPDDPVYSTGLVIGGRRLKPPRKNTKQNAPADLNLKRVVKELTDEAEAALEDSED